jgi:hypothetical protein
MGQPSSPHSGSGVLARLTLKAVGAGISPAILITLDANNDGKPDLGSRLKDPQEKPLGDINSDEFFDGTVVNAQIAVDRDCPPGPAPTAIPSSTTSPATASPTAGDRQTAVATAATGTPAAAPTSPTASATATGTPAIISPTPGVSSPAEDGGTDWGSPGFIAAYVGAGAVAVLAVGGLAFFGARRRRS